MQTVIFRLRLRYPHSRRMRIDDCAHEDNELTELLGEQLLVREGVIGYEQT